MSNASKRALLSLTRTLECSHRVSSFRQTRSFLHVVAKNAWTSQHMRPAEIAITPQLSSLVTTRGIRQRARHFQNSVKPRVGKSEVPAPNSAQEQEVLREPKDEAAAAQDDAPVYTWRDYNDETGMPLPEGPLGRPDIIRLFGNDVSYEEGNHALQILQWRRESGVLSDKGISFPDGPNIPRNLALIALEHLRERYPMDEEGAAEEWVRLEAERLEHEMYEKGARWGLFKKDETAVLDVSKEEHATQQGTEYGEKRHGFSVLEQIQREARAKEEEEREAERAKGNRPLTKAERDEEAKQMQLVEAKEQIDIIYAEMAERKRKREEKAAAFKEPPEVLLKMSFFKRIWPAATMTSLIIIACLLYGATYTPPSASERLFPDYPPALATVAALLTINFAVFLLWHTPLVWKLFNRIMVIQPIFPRPLAMIGNVFSHQEFKHLASNFIGILLIAPSLHEQIGRGDFLSIYIASGVFSSFVMTVWLIRRRLFLSYLMGASGALYGVIGALCVVMESVRIPFTHYELPYTPKLFLVGILSVEAFHMAFKKIRGGGPVVSRLAHIVGTLWGAGHMYAIKARYSLGQYPNRRSKDTERRDVPVATRS
ncbi:hypothetical protein EJ05DRAFT_187004 [Pseudovirgaria hyperparasitica]|uniref:Peptidase S54 rhomboid domain-containing protein n=1 Tax=Pseudovirgaria hyperparasitica TaxID=470096 RepID=A0A6A6WIK4_9PEZI|nr:uncharacterized protein EJ05DRAFT_187004 [Pseudovirgaria hyperparasitica]KAF2761856.1 hypothetical protein EJ05DRAFT_187004 [Pseudovirgaria hyperparasitica]